MSSLRVFFLQRRPSEKLLLTAFLGIGVAIWLSSFWTRASAFTGQAKDRRAQLAEQKMWIDREAQIEKVTADALSTLRPEKSLSASALQSRLDSLRSQSGLSQNMASIKGAGSTQSPQFTVNNAQVQINVQNTDASWGQVQAFYQALLKESPYITLQAPFQTTVSGAGRGPGTIQVVFNVSAVEMKAR